MKKAKKETIKTSVMLAIIFALMGLCTFMGIQAITNSQSTKFNLGVVYGANYAVVVEMKTGAGENDFITIFDSTNPANINTAYIQSISNYTIRFNPEHLYLTGSTGIATFRVTAKEDSASGGSDLECTLNCGSNENKSNKLLKDSPLVISIATGIDASTTQPSTTDLGSVVMNLSIGKYTIPYNGVLKAASYGVLVEMKSGAGSNDFVTIYNSINPSSVNSAYSEYIEDGIFCFNTKKLYLTGSTGIATFRITARENEVAGGTDLQCSLDCGATGTKTTLKKDTAVLATVATGLDASSSQPNATNLGALAINLNIEKYCIAVKIEGLRKDGSYVVLYDPINGYEFEEGELEYVSSYMDVKDYSRVHVRGHIMEINNYAAKFLNFDAFPYYITRYPNETRDIYMVVSDDERYKNDYETLFYRNLSTVRTNIYSHHWVDGVDKVLTVRENTGFCINTTQSYYSKSPDFTIFFNDGETKNLWLGVSHNIPFYANVEAIQLNAYASSAYMHYVMNGVEDVLSHNGSNLPSEKLYLTGDLEFTGEWSSQNCILAETMILMADGTEKAIGDIVVGDVILSYDWETMQLIENPVIYASSQDDTVDWTTIRWFERKFRDDETGEITIIKNAFAHRFYNVTQGGFVYLDLWEIGDKILKQDGSTATLISVEKVYGDCTFARITGQFGANYFANGCLSGDRNCPWGLDLDALQYPTQYTFPN